MISEQLPWEYIYRMIYSSIGGYSAYRSWFWDFVPVRSRFVPWKLRSILPSSLARPRSHFPISYLDSQVFPNPSFRFERCWIGFLALKLPLTVQHWIQSFPIMSPSFHCHEGCWIFILTISYFAFKLPVSGPSSQDSYFLCTLSCSLLVRFFLQSNSRFQSVLDWRGVFLYSSCRSVHPWLIMRPYCIPIADSRAFLIGDELVLYPNLSWFLEVPKRDP